MFILKVKNLVTGQIQQSDFHTMEECNAHIAAYEDSWGKKAYDETIPAWDEVAPEVKDELGNVITPEGVFNHPETVIHHEQEYEFTVKDITAEIEAERVKKETKRTDRLTRVDQLKAIDWTTITTIASLKAIVRVLAKEAIKDDE